jgi:VanZ family protein
MPALAWILAMLWMAGMIYTSSLGEAVTPLGGLMQMLASKLGHVLEYAVLGALLTVAVRQEVPERWPRFRALFIVAVIGLTFASFDELRQSFVPGRGPRVTDVLLDLVSLLAGAVGLLRLERELENKERAATSR